MINTLQVLLGSLNVLYMKYRQFHWNVESPNFKSLHDFFAGEYTSLEATIDTVAEFIRTYEFYALGTFQDFLKVSIISENTLYEISDVSMLQTLKDDHVMLSEWLRTKINGETYDLVAQNLLITILESSQKTLWMLKSQIV